MADSDKPNILVIWGDDIGITNLSCYSDGLMDTGHRISTESRTRACDLRTPTASRATPPDGRRAATLTIDQVVEKLQTTLTSGT